LPPHVATDDKRPTLAVLAPDGARFLFVLYDDTGLAAWSPYGGRINMPTLDKLAASSLTYTQWPRTRTSKRKRSERS
jgi:arylsulfatase